MSETTKKLKFISTAYRVLIILVLLNQGKCSIEDLIRKLSAFESIARYLSRDAILKYINTLKFCDYKILKATKKGKHFFFLDKSPFSMSLTEKQIESLAAMEVYINSLHQPYLSSCFNSTVKKVHRYFSEDDFKKYKKLKTIHNKNKPQHYKELAAHISKIEKFCLENQTVFVTYAPIEGLIQQHIIVPEMIEYSNQKAFFCGYDPKYKDKKRYQIDKVIEIKPLPHKSFQVNYKHSVQFKLTGKLAQIYRLYEGEEVITRLHNPPEIVVCSHVDDVDILIGRLLRYSQFCEVLSPAGVRNKVQKTIQTMISFYEEKTG